MAKIASRTLTINMSKLVRTNEEVGFEIPEDLVLHLEAMVTELLGDAALVVEVSAED